MALEDLDLVYITVQLHFDKYFMKFCYLQLSGKSLVRDIDELLSKNSSEKLGRSVANFCELTKCQNSNQEGMGQIQEAANPE